MSDEIKEFPMQESDPAEKTEASVEVDWQLEGMDFVEAPKEERVVDESIDASEESEELEQAAAKIFVEHERLISVLESVLFTSERPVGLGIFKQIFKGTNIRSKNIVEGLEELKSHYAAANRGVTLEDIGGGYQLRTKMDNSEFMQRLAKTRPFKLTGPSLEVLSILAYQQPMTKGQIDEIRGVESGHLVRALMERGLVHFAGKSELPGKPMLYATTRKFLEIFGLRNLKELPSLAEIDELLPEGIEAEDENKPLLSDLTEAMSQSVQSTYSEGEDELLNIQGELEKISTSTGFFEEEKRREKEKRDLERAQDIREALVLGEVVDDKEKTWLKRYEQRIEQEAAMVAQGIAAQSVAAQSTDAQEQQQDQALQLDDEAAMLAAHALAEEEASEEEYFALDGEHEEK